MIFNQEDYEKKRIPVELLEFIDNLKTVVQLNKQERYLTYQKNGLYKQLLEELVPLSYFVSLEYPDCFIEPKLGNQGYDAVIYNIKNEEIAKVEITSPHDGYQKSRDSQMLMKRGYGKIKVGSPSDDFDDFFKYVLNTCRKKAKIDYSKCVLVICITPLPPFAGFEEIYESKVNYLIEEIAKIKFKAKRIFLLIPPDRIETIKDPY